MIKPRVFCAALWVIGAVLASSRVLGQVPAAAATGVATVDTLSVAGAGPYTAALLPRVRAAASAVPGELPKSLHYLKYAESVGTLADFLEGGSTEKFLAVFTVFQVRYQHGWIMLDAGHDREVDQSFHGEGHRFWEDRHQRSQRAMRDANLIVVTHEHHDHVAGVVRSPFADEVAAKTLLTRAQVETLKERPIVPLIRLGAEAAQKYLVIDYALLYPLAPGAVLIRAPGHTPGSQMLYVRLASGPEAIFVGDVVWAMAGIEARRQKPEAVSRALGEDRVGLQQQIDWLQHVTSRNGVMLVGCHDEQSLRSLVQKGLLKDDLDLSPRR